MVAPINSRIAPTMERMKPARVQAQNLSETGGTRGELGAEEAGERATEGGRTP